MINPESQTRKTQMSRTLHKPSQPEAPRIHCCVLDWDSKLADRQSQEGSRPPTRRSTDQISTIELWTFLDSK